MEKTLKTSSNHLTLGCILLSVFTFLATLLNAEDPYFIIGLLFASLLSIGLWKKGFSFHKIDILLLAIYGYELLSLLWSPQAALVRQTLVDDTLAILYYFTIRCFFGNDKGQQRLLLIYCLLFGLLSLMALASFYWFQEIIQNVGFDCLYEFRHLYRPLGKPDNDWSSLQLLFLGLITLCIYQNQTSFGLRRHVLLLLYAGVCFLLLVSFSRGIYLAFGVWTLFLLIFWWKSRWSRWLTDLMVMKVVVCLLAAGLYYQEMSTVCKMQHTVSQQRSTQGRLQSAKEAAKVIQAHIWNGSGVGTYAQRMNQAVSEDTTRNYTSYASNIWLQIGVEQGVIGVLLYLFLGIVVVVTVFRRWSYLSVLGLATLCVFAIREQSFSIFFHSLQAKWLVYTWLALLVDIRCQNDDLFAGKYWKHVLVTSLPLLAWVLIVFFLVQRQLILRQQLDFAEACRQKRYDQAEVLLSAMPNTTPFLITRALYHQKRYANTCQAHYAELAHQEWKEAREQTPEDYMLAYGDVCLLMTEGKMSSARHQLDSLINIYPRNSTFLLKMYDLCQAMGDSVQARTCLIQSICLEPCLLEVYEFQELMGDSELRTEMLASLNGGMDGNPLNLAHAGKILLELGNYQKAEDYLVRALSLLPNLSMAWYNLGRLKAEMGQVEEEILYKRRGIALETGSDVPDEAIKLFEEQQKTMMLLRFYGFGGKRYKFLFKQWYTYDLIEKN